MTRYTIALMCAENDPLDCHRFSLICRFWGERDIVHLRGDGRLEAHTDAENRLLARWGLPPGDLFSDRAEFLERAYDLQGQRLAYRRSAPESES